MLQCAIDRQKVVVHVVKSQNSGSCLETSIVLHSSVALSIYVIPLHHKISQLAMSLQKPHACIQRVSSFQCTPSRQFTRWRCCSRL